jgi:hypothetical protein
MSVQQSSSRYAAGPSPSGLSDVLDLILDKGLVIDVYLRVSLAGIELLTVDARVVVASVDTYLRFAEAVGRLDLSEQKESLLEFARTGEQRIKQSAVGGVIEGIADELAEALPSDDEDE